MGGKETPRGEVEGLSSFKGEGHHQGELQLEEGFHKGSSEN